MQSCASRCDSFAYPDSDSTCVSFEVFRYSASHKWCCTASSTCTLAQAGANQQLYGGDVEGDLFVRKPEQSASASASESSASASEEQSESTSASAVAEPQKSSQSLSASESPSPSTSEQAPSESPSPSESLSASESPSPSHCPVDMAENGPTGCVKCGFNRLRDPQNARHCICAWNNGFRTVDRFTPGYPHSYSAAEVASHY